MMTMLQYPGRERYPGVEEPVLNFLASPQIREGGRGREPVPHSVAVDRYCRSTSADKQNSPRGHPYIMTLSKTAWKRL